MADIIHRVGIQAPISKVYEAVSTVEGVAGWWTKQTTGASKKTGDTMDVRFLSPSGKEIGGMTMEILALEPNKKVRWRFKKGMLPERPSMYWSKSRRPPIVNCSNRQI